MAQALGLLPRRVRRELFFHIHCWCHCALGSYSCISPPRDGLEHGRALPLSP